MNTYVTADEAEAYFASYPNSAWDGDTDTKAQALINATQSVDALYGDGYLSGIYNETQDLLFPRFPFYDHRGRYITGIPTSLKNAVCELAALGLSGTDLFPVSSTDANVTERTSKVGELQETVKWSKAPDTASFEGFRKVDLLIAPLLCKKGGNWSLKA
ncbi:DnaT-like ssDNA-binding protein [Variovorax fucosicus]|uniref:DnaT-like ssDNA-binding protein n=1 Tax=Variovorax fucosicus TaxID=3053517 RepID=UPI0025776B5C|nr:DnaT-like ssDNA-binding protein [Variovorax sp. J22R193]